MDYPAPINRLKAFFIDYLLIIILFTIAAFLIESLGDAPNWTRGLFFLLMVFLYEPLSVSQFGGTLGHHLMGLEVRRYSNPTKRVNLFIASVRVLLKIFLGFISIIVCYVNEERRAIHDLAFDTAVVYKREVNDQEGDDD